MKKTLLILTFSIAMLMPGTVLLAQGFNDTDQVEDNNVPFDGGISVLLVAGAALGAKKVRDQRKKKEAGKHAL